VRPSDFGELRYEVDQGVALVTLDRPERHNAWGGRMAVEYRWALHHAHVDPAVRVVVVTGAGADFCVGADTALLGRISDDGGRYRAEDAELPPYPDDAPPALRHNHTYPLSISTPVIAAINGRCAGVGLIVATYADLRFAAADARITTSFARLGLPAEYGIAWLLPRIVGVAAAAELLYASAVIDAAEALRIGLVQRLLPASDLVRATVEFARRLARESSGESLRMMKRQLFVESTADLDTAYRRSVELMNRAVAHPDMREGLAALRERRPPDFLPAGGMQGGVPPLDGRGSAQR
jgi:enoyl-CoA hydratase/carnithine racemase